MVAYIFAVFAACASLLAVRADVDPSEPSPGGLYREGQPCPISWNADPDSPTIWKSMTIELMSGSNFDMKHVSTVATNQDGTVNGRFQYPCPKVTPNSAIYFYQFTSSLTTNKTWTTRFTIASPAGDTTPPANSVQPGTGEEIPWGIGELVDSAAANSSLAPSTTASLPVATVTTTTLATTSPTVSLPASVPSPAIVTATRSSGLGLVPDSSTTQRVTSTANASAEVPNGALGMFNSDILWHCSASILATLVLALHL